MARILSENLCISVILFLIVELCKCTDDLTCVQENACLCRFKDDRVINISKFSSGYNVTQVNSTYYFFGCKNGAVPDTKYINVTNNCKETSLCLYNSTSKELINLGNTTQVKFNQSQENPQAFELLYDVNNRTSRVLLVCSPELSTTIFVISPKNENSKHNLIIISPLACKITEHVHSLSTGSTLLILFLVACGIYFIGGAIVLHFLRGARGTEMIPNVDFWRDLPNLVKDGLIFLLNGCRPTAVATAESYDRI